MKNALPLWNLIAMLWIVIILLLFYAWQPQEINIGIVLKKNKIADFFTKPPPYQPLLTEVAKSYEILQFDTQENPALKIDSTSQHILIVGDSMAGAAGLEYGFTFYAWHNKHKLTIFSLPSSSTIWWSEQKKLTELILEHKPTFIIISLGSNELFYKDIESREPYIQDILAQAGAIKTIWVGPPNWKKDTGINDLIEKNVGKDCFFRSENIKLSRQADGIHPDIKGSEAWADTLSSWIMQECRHKIILAKPPKN